MNMSLRLLTVMTVIVMACCGQSEPRFQVRQAVINSNPQLHLAQGVLDRLDARGNDLDAGLRVVMGTSACQSGHACYSCFQCHGLRGEGSGIAAIPRLAGQEAGYLLLSLRQFVSGERPSRTMSEVARALTDEQLRAVSAYYAALRTAPNPVPVEDDLRSAADSTGQRIANEGLPRQGVPGCVTCHGRAVREANARNPDIAGQYADYLVSQLDQFRAGQRKGVDAAIMQTIARNLTPEQSRQVATFYSAQPPEPIASAHPRETRRPSNALSQVRDTL